MVEWVTRLGRVWKSASLLSKTRNSVSSLASAFPFILDFQRRFYFAGNVFCSGMATVTAITSHLISGEHIVCCDDVYGGEHWAFLPQRRDIGVRLFSGIRFSLIHHVASSFSLLKTTVNPLISRAEESQLVSRLFEVLLRLIFEAYFWGFIIWGLFIWHILVPWCYIFFKFVCQWTTLLVCFFV